MRGVNINLKACTVTALLAFMVVCTFILSEWAPLPDCCGFRDQNFKWQVS